MKWIKRFFLWNWWLTQFCLFIQFFLIYVICQYISISWHPFIPFTLLSKTNRFLWCLYSLKIFGSIINKKKFKQGLESPFSNLYTRVVLILKNIAPNILFLMLWGLASCKTLLFCSIPHKLKVEKLWYQQKTNPTYLLLVNILHHILMSGL